MLARQQTRTVALTFINRNHFGLGSVIMHWLRTALNRVRWEENQQFHAIEQRGSTIPKSAEQAKQVFIASQKGLAVSEKERMERIDQILGTRTYFHEGKVYQERLDSDHLMVIDQIREENPEKSRRELDWQNPQADVKIRYKHKKSYYNLLSKLRIYPKHPPATYQLNDNTNKDTIAFLAAQNAYSIVSFKPVELAMESIQQESLVLSQEKPFSSAKYCYFRPQHSMVLLRILKEFYQPALIKDQGAINEVEASIESVISLQEVYQALKDYDEDERVAFYLRKIENNRLDYLFSDFTLDREENRVAVTIDLMGDGKEYCVLIKSLVNPEKYKPRPIFNLKPHVVFSPDSNDIYFIQRSGEGGWIQLVSRSVGSCWKAEGIEPVQEDQGIVYRCSAQMQMKLGSIWNSDYIFVTVSSYGREYSQNLFLVLPNEQGLKLLPIDEDGHCKYFYDLWQNGVVIGKKRQINDRLKYGEAEYLIEKIELIPFKQHIMAINSIGLSDLQLTGKVEKFSPKPQDLDVTKKKTIFVPDSHQFIREAQAKNTHLVLVQNFESVYDRASLYFLPSNSHAHPHSIIIRGDPRLRLEQMGSNYNSQLVKFSQFQGLLNCQKEYNIWKRQLREQEQSSRYHRESITIDSNGYAFELQLLCKKMYLSEKQLPVILVLEDSGEKINQEAMQQLLEKGVMLAKFGGRGTQTKDLQHYFAGSKHNFRFMLDDLQAAIQFIGNEMTQNISLFCKGQISSLIGLWFNFYFPNLFNASVLHNGLYDLTDQTAVSSFGDFFGAYKEPNQAKQTNEKENQQEEKSEQQQAEKKNTQKDAIKMTQQLKGIDLKKFNMFNYKFAEITKRNQSQLKNERTLGHIENVIVSSDEKHRQHSRKLIKRLRQNSNFRFDEVYLKEYDHQYQADLFNLSYLYKHIRERMERELNNPQELQEEDESKE